MRYSCRLLIILGMLVSAPLLARAQEAPAQEAPALTPLWPDGAPMARGKTPADIPGVYVYLPGKSLRNGSAVVICPGGGYGHLAMDHEGRQVAQWLNKLGTAGIVLKYRHAPGYKHPVPLLDVQRALRYTRAHAREWGIDPARVGVLGFSAGGHLASTAATHFDAGQADAKDPIDRMSCRPDFAILGYPVIQMEGPYVHKGSRRNLLGDNPDPKLVHSLSNDTQVTAKTPPTFLVHTSEDRGVPPGNSIVFYQALIKNNVPAELHIFQKGRHGLGLGPADLAFSAWPDRCAAWLRGLGVLDKKQ